MRLCTAGVLLGLALAAPAAADRDPAAADAAAKEAEALARAQKYEQAAARFRAAYRLDPRAEYICNVGVAYQRAKILPRAQLYLGECLVHGGSLDGKFIALVRSALAAVEAKLRDADYTPLDITVVPDTAVITLGDFDTDEAFIGPRVIWVAFGKHTITASAEGHVTEPRAISAQTRARQAVHLELRAEPAIAAPLPLAPAAPPRSRVPAIAATSAAAVAGGVGIGLWISARGIMHDADSAQITRGEYDAIVHRARDRQHLAWALGGISGAAAVVGGVLWHRATRAPALEVTPTGSGATVSWSGRW